MNEKKNLGFDTIKSALILFVLLYLFWFKEAFFSIDIILYGASAFLLFIVIAELLIAGGRLRWHPIFGAWLIFIIYSLIIGLATSINISSFLFALAKFFIYLLICYEVWSTSIVSGSVNWFLKILIFCGIICSIQCLFAGHHYNGGRVITMSQNNNPNYIATVILTAFIATLLFESEFGVFNKLKPLIIAVFSYVVILTGSRKVFYALVLLLIPWVFIYLKRLRFKSKKKYLVMILLVLIGGVAIIFYNRNIFASTVMYSKISSQKDALADRLELYREAFDVWKRHPILGVGFNQFSEYSSDGRFSHSTYAEILVTSGIIGTVIFFVPFILWLVKVCKSWLCENNREVKYYFSFIILLMIIVLALGLGQIWVYEIEHILIITLAITFFDIKTTKSNLYEIQKSKQ